MVLKLKIFFKERGWLQCHGRAGVNLTMWWLVLASQRRNSEVVQGCWWWPGTLGWGAWVLSVLQLREEAKYYSNRYTCSCVCVCMCFCTIVTDCNTQGTSGTFGKGLHFTWGKPGGDIFLATRLTHREHWQKRWPSGSQTHWMRYTGRRRWILTAHCWESRCRPPPCECGPQEHLARDRTHCPKYTGKFYNSNNKMKPAHLYHKLLNVICRLYNNASSTTAP